MQSEDQRTTGESVAEEHATEFPLAPPAPVPHTDEIIQPANVPPQEDDAPTSATPAPKGAGENDVDTAAIHPLYQGAPADSLLVPVAASVLSISPYPAHPIRRFPLPSALRRTRTR